MKIKIKKRWSSRNMILTKYQKVKAVSIKMDWHIINLLVQTLNQKKEKVRRRKKYQATF